MSKAQSHYQINGNWQRSYSLYDRNKKNKYIGQGQPKFTPVEIVDYEVYEAGSPLALDNG